MGPVTISAIIGGIGGLINGVSAIASKRASAREAERARGVQRKLLEDARGEYLRDYNTPMVNRSDVGYMLREGRKAMVDGNRADRQRALVSGASGEAVSQSVGARAGAYGDMVARVGALGQRVKDNALARWQESQRHYADVMSGMHDASARSHAVSANNALRGLGDSVVSVGDAWLKGSAKTKKDA